MELLPIVRAANHVLASRHVASGACIGPAIEHAMTDDTEQDALTDVERDRWEDLANTPLKDLSDKEVTSKIKLSVKRRFSYPEWVLMFEFGAGLVAGHARG